MNNVINILAIGDVVGRPGRNVLSQKLQGIVDQHRIDLVIVNGENASGGMSITSKTVKELFAIGAHVITTGNHIWNNSEILTIIDKEPLFLRPANYPNGVPGKGYALTQVKGCSISIINLMGRTFMLPLDCPFRTFDEIYNSIKNESEIIIVDFHAESTSEKIAFGWYADGRASAVFGTHTHVQTADETILHKGTGYITDIGMTGSFDSVIGIQKEHSIERFIKQTKVRFRVAENDCHINGVIFVIQRNGKTQSVKRIIA